MNEMQAAGMDAVGETGEVPQRRATDELKTVRMAGEPYAKALKLRAAFDYEAGLEIKAVSYVDDINGEQVCRDDLWLATTEALNKLGGIAAPPDYRTIATDLCATIDSEYPAPEYSNDFRNGMTCGLVKLNHRVLKAAGVAAAPVVAVVAAEKQRDAFLWLPNLSDLTRYGWSEAYIGESSELVVDAEGNYVKFADVQALASQAQAAVSARVGGFVLQARSPEGDPWQDVSADDFHKAAANGYETRVISAGLAAQAAVGVASQQEQSECDQIGHNFEIYSTDGKQKCMSCDLEYMPQPSCNAALRAAPEGQHEAGNAVLAEITDALATIVKYLSDTDDEGLIEHAEPMVAALSALAKARRQLRSDVPRVRGEGENKDSSESPDLASIASQAQGEVRLMREALEEVERVAQLSDGIAGWHMNGEIAPWHDLLPEVFDALEATKHLRATPTES